MSKPVASASGSSGGVAGDKPNKAETDAAHVVPNSSRLVLDTCKSASVAVVSTIKASGKALSLKQPLSACVDQKTGVIYVADSESYCIRRVNPDSTEGKQFVAPKLVKLPPRPAASAADTKSDTKSGAATATATATATAAGSGSGSGGDSKDEKIAAALIAAVKPTTPYDGPVATATFHSPYGIAVDSRGDLFVSDSGVHKVRKINMADGTVSTFAGSGLKGFADGNGTAATFSTPYDITIDKNDNLYVCDADNERVRKITPSGVVSTLCGSGERGAKNDKKPLAASFSFPVGSGVDDQGNVYIADCGNHQIRRMDGASGEVTLYAGSGREGWEDGAAADARFSFPGGCVCDRNGAVYVADSGGHKIRRIAPINAWSDLNRCLGEPVDIQFPKEILNLIHSYCNEIIATTVAGSSTVGKSDGVGTAAGFNWLYHLAIERQDPTTNTVVLIAVDKTNHLLRRVIYKW